MHGAFDVLCLGACSCLHYCRHLVCLPSAADLTPSTACVSNSPSSSPPRQVIDITWPVGEGAGGLVGALGRIAEEASQAIDDGYDYVVLSDRTAGEAL